MLGDTNTPPRSMPVASEMYLPSTGVVASAIDPVVPVGTGIGSTVRRMRSSSDGRAERRSIREPVASAALRRTIVPEASRRIASTNVAFATRPSASLPVASPLGTKVRSAKSAVSTYREME